MEEMRALKPHPYDCIERNVGDKYMAGESYIPLLIGLGWAERVIAEPPPNVEDKKRAYRRRDMTAE